MGNCVSSKSSQRDPTIIVKLPRQREMAFVLDSARRYYMPSPIFLRKRSASESCSIHERYIFNTDIVENDNNDEDHDDNGNNNAYEQLSESITRDIQFDDINSAAVTFSRGIHRLSIRSSGKWSKNWLSQPLHEAAYYSHQHVVELLIASGIDIDSYDKCNNTPLSLAAIRGHIHIVQTLICAGCDVNTATNGGNTVLHLMASTGNQDITKLLLDAGADVNIFNSHYHTPIYLALTHRNLMVLSTLIAGGANVHYQASSGQTYLHLAALDAFPEAVLMLLKTGTDFNAQDANGNTPLILATKARCLKSMQYLLQFGCDPNLRNSLGKTAFYYAVLATPKPDERAMMMLLLAGLHIDKHDRETLCQDVLGARTASLLENLLLSVPSLQQTCRLAIRTNLGVPTLSKVATLPLPRLLKYYLIMNDLSVLTGQHHSMHSNP